MIGWSDEGGGAPVALILGTNEIASAVAVHLWRAGFASVLSHDPHPPVIRRAMAFHDVLYGETVAIAGVGAEPIEEGGHIGFFGRREPRIGVTRLGFSDLYPHTRFALLADARMNKHAVKPDLRLLTPLAIGLGPGFSVGGNCDVAIETRPARNGTVLGAGATDAADGRSARLGEAGGERFARADRPGRWRTALEIGTRLFRGVTVGLLDGVPVAAPIDGVLRGVVRDGTEVPEGVKLLEIDPRGRRRASWTGIDERGAAIADAVVRAARAHRPVAVPAR